MPSLRIFLRTSMRKHNPLIKRPFGLDNREDLVLKCADSLAVSIEESGKEVFVEVIDDSSPDDFIQKLSEIFNKHEIRYKIWRMKFGSNNLSLMFSYDLMGVAREEIFYLCDDDYLFLPSAIKEIIEAYEDKVVGTNQFVIFPSDYPERYEKIYPSYIFLGKKRHWRSIGHTTGNIFITKRLFHQNKSVFYRFADTLSERDTINYLWKKIKVISPMPSLSAHLNDDTLPPFVNWEKMI